MASFLTLYIYMTRRLLLLILTLLPALLTAQVAQVSRKQVEKIDIVLHRVTAQSSVDPNSIRARMKTKVGDAFSQIDFDQDLKTLAEEFDRVEPRVDVRGDKIGIALDIWPKPVIRSIEFCGNERIKAKKLRDELEVAIGTIFDRYCFNQAFHKLQEYYIRKGFFEAELRYLLIPDPTSNEVDIKIEICEGRSGRIRQICFEGFTKQERSDLCTLIATKKYSFLVSFINHSGTYHEEMVEQDRYIVLNYLHNLGYADAGVAILIEEAECGGICLKIVADRGPQYYFGEITYAGNCVFSNCAVENHLCIQSGQPYSPERLRDAIRGLQDMYGTKGYIEAVINYEPQLQHNALCYNIHFDIEEGEQYRVGIVRVFGNSCTLQGVILHESLLTPGDVFDIRKLQKTEETLEHVGYFESVNVYAVKTQQDSCLGPSFRDVYIEVEEKGTGNISFFAGYSTIDSVFGGFEVIERNFRMMGIPCVPKQGLCALRGGGEFLRVRVNFGQKQDDFLIAWTKPFFMDTPWIVGVDTEYSQNRTISKAYELDNFNFGLHSTYPVNKFLAVSGRYRLRDMHVKLEESASTAPPLLVIESKRDGTVSAASLAFSYDSVDNPRDAYNGFRSLGSLEVAGIGGNYDFVALNYINTLYHQLYACGVLKLRADFRFIVPFGRTRATTLPLNERIFMGGETTVRGYRSYSIGPQYIGLNGEPSGDPRGGVSSMLFSVEYNHKFHRCFHGFVFFDAAYNTLHVWSVAPFRTSVGIGIRFEVLQQVPIMIGYGWPLNPERPTDVQRFFFALGAAF